MAQVANLVAGGRGSIFCLCLQALSSHVVLAALNPDRRFALSSGQDFPQNRTNLLLRKSPRGAGEPSHFSFSELIGSHEDSECDSEVGAGRLKRYSSLNDQFCNSESSSGASFACAAQWDVKRGGVARSEDYLCRGSNLKVSFQSGKPVKIYGRGSGCQWKLAKNGLQLTYFLFPDVCPSPYAPLELHSGSAGEQCTEDLGSKTLLLYSENDYWNPYISQAQAIMAYVSAAALDLDLANTRVLFTSQPNPKETNKPKMVPLIEGLFSKGGASMMPSEQPRLVCASDVVVPVGGKASFIRKHATMDDPWASQCRNAPLLKSYGSFLLKSFDVTPTAPSTAKERIVVLARRPTATHPDAFRRSLTNADEVERAIEADDRSLALHMGSLMQVSQEAAQNDALLEVAAALKESCAQSQTSTVDVEEAAPETLTITEQAKLFANTDIVIAPHSAALSWMSVMPKCAQVLEFCAPGNYQFVNYAKLTGTDHACLPGVGSWGTSSFRADAKRVVKEVEAASHRRSQCLKAQR